MKQIENRWLALCLSFILGMSYHDARAQNNYEGPDSIHISQDFLKALEGAFQFDPIEDTLRYQEDFLTREQLHEWVGNVDTTINENYRPRYDFAEGDSMIDTLRLDPRFIGFTPPKESVSIMFPDFSKEIEIWKSRNGKYSFINAPNGGVGSMSGFDVKYTLSSLLIPKYRKIKKSRKLAEKNRQVMDAAFPL